MRGIVGQIPTAYTGTAGDPPVIPMLNYILKGAFLHLGTGSLGTLTHLIYTHLRHELGRSQLRVLGVALAVDKRQNSVEYRGGQLLSSWALGEQFVSTCPGSFAQLLRVGRGSGGTTKRPEHVWRSRAHGQ